MRVLVTGATGFLGGATARSFAAAGFDVRATGRNTRLGAQLGIPFQPADLRHASAADGLIAGCDIIVHCGGLSTAWAERREFFACNVQACRNLIESARRQAVRRFVYVSTPSIYFDFSHRLNIAETDPLAVKPVNAYAESKLEAEKIVARAHKDGLDTVVVRPKAIFGPGDNALLPRLLRIAAKGWLPLIDGGRALIDLTYVNNVAEALVSAAVASPAVSGKVYNISNGEPLLVQDIMQQLVALLKLPVRLVDIPFSAAYVAAGLMEAWSYARPGRPEPRLTRYTVGMLARSQTFSIKAAQQDLSYTPSVGLSDALSLTCAWWRSQNA